MHDDLERQLSGMAAAPPAPEAFLVRVRRRGRRRQAALVGAAAAVIGVAGLAVVVGLPSPGRGGVGEESLPIAGDERRGLPEEAVSLVGYRGLANGGGSPALGNGFEGEPTLGRLRFSGAWLDRL